MVQQEMGRLKDTALLTTVYLMDIATYVDSYLDMQKDVIYFRQVQFVMLIKIQQQ